MSKVPRLAGGAYDVTQMQNGHYRAECLWPDCGWWTDTVTHDAASTLLKNHMKAAHSVRNISLRKAS